jgi:hypothetical protein
MWNNIIVNGMLVAKKKKKIPGLSILEVFPLNKPGVLKIFFFSYISRF